MQGQYAVSGLHTQLTRNRFLTLSYYRPCGRLFHFSMHLQNEGKKPYPKGKMWLWMIWNKMWQIVVIWSIDCFADFLSQCLCFLQYSLAHWHIIKPWSFPSLAIHFFSTNNFMLYWFYFFRFHSIHCQMSIYFATTFAFCVAVITN